MAAESPKKKILIADDDPEIRTLLNVKLSSSGFTVVEAEDGEQALEMVQSESPALLILDIMMPKKSGWEVAKAVRQDRAMDHVGIIVLTAIGETMSEMTSPLVGADDHLDKPFAFEDLEQKIRDVLAARSPAPQP
jgi:DNA-binding response OmpR family regulator